MTATTTPFTPDLLISATVGEVMRPGVVTCAPAATIPAIAAAMMTHGIHAVVVNAIPGHDPLAISDLELLAGALRGGDPRAGDLARELIDTISTREPIAHAIDIMSTRSVSHLLAVDPDSGDPAGVVSTLDVAAAAAGIKPSVEYDASRCPESGSTASRCETERVLMCRWRARGALASSGVDELARQMAGAEGRRRAEPRPAARDR